MASDACQTSASALNSVFYAPFGALLVSNFAVSNFAVNHVYSFLLRCAGVFAVARGKVITSDLPQLHGRRYLTVTYHAELLSNLLLISGVTSLSAGIMGPGSKLKTILAITAFLASSSLHAVGTERVYIEDTDRFPGWKGELPRAELSGPSIGYGDSGKVSPLPLYLIVDTRQKYRASMHLFAEEQVMCLDGGLYCIVRLAPPDMLVSWTSGRVAR